jgi:UDP-N-acetylglucosamine 2-epimerase (non-hydrolysing)/UDP-GlcNAc3NAcA epimerase
MADVAVMATPAAERSDVLDRLGVEAGSYLLVTAHRAANVDEREPLARLVDLLESLPPPVVFPVHPRTRARLAESGFVTRLEEDDGVLLVKPLGYFDFLKLLRHARALLTDSGGAQKEAYLAGVPCLTLRDTTEWVETLEFGWNRLVGLDKRLVLDALGDLERPADRPELYGGGRAGERVVEAIDQWAGTLVGRAAVSPLRPE